MKKKTDTESRIAHLQRENRRLMYEYNKLNPYEKTLPKGIAIFKDALKAKQALNKINKTIKNK